MRGCVITYLDLHCGHWNIHMGFAITTYSILSEVTMNDTEKARLFGAVLGLLSDQELDLVFIREMGTENVDLPRAWKINSLMIWLYGESL